MASRPIRPRAKALTAYRIADARHPIFDGTGAFLIGGRWNSPGRPVIYAAASYAGAMLECLAHAGTGRIPRNQKAILITIPGRVSIEERTAEDLPPGWERDDNIASRSFGDAWLENRQSAVLIVPSAVAKYDRNVLINPAHPDFKRIVASRPETVVWDARLFRR
jgi:RES domain-containing protein